MRQIPEPTLFDTRLLKRHLKEGLITQQQIDDRLKELDDLADHAELLDVEALKHTR